MVGPLVVSSAPEPHTWLGDKLLALARAFIEGACDDHLANQFRDVVRALVHLRVRDEPGLRAQMLPLALLDEQLPWHDALPDQIDLGWMAHNPELVLLAHLLCRRRIDALHAIWRTDRPIGDPALTTAQQSDAGAAAGDDRPPPRRLYSPMSTRTVFEATMAPSTLADIVNSSEPRSSARAE